MSSAFGHGLVIGKFHPFHRGHGHLLRAAESQCERVTAIVCGRRSDGVSLLGAESPGKTTLAAALADAYGTVWVPEYGHLYQALGRDDPNGEWASEEFIRIARMQRWLEDFQASQASRVVFCDTDIFTT